MADGTYLAVCAEAPDPAAFLIERAAIEGAGGELRLAAVDDEDSLIDALREANAVLVLQAQITRRVIEAMPECRHIVRYGVGLDTLDIPAATEHGIVVSHFPDFCQDEVANHTMMLLLGCARRLGWLDRALRHGHWRGGTLAPVGAIRGETLGLVAFGAISRAVAHRAKAFGLRVVAWDPYQDESTFTREGVERATSFHELLRQADYVSVHAPLTAETRHLFDRHAFEAMKPSAYLINTSRGPVVDEAALVEALQAGKIAGAGLDVFEAEPLAGSSPLLSMENVLLTPHTAFYSDASFDDLRRRVGRAVADVMSGRWPEHVANPGVLPKTPLA